MWGLKEEEGDRKDTHLAASDLLLGLFWSPLAWLAHRNSPIKWLCDLFETLFGRGSTMNCKIWVKDRTIEIWIDALEGLPKTYNDVEIVRKHPFLLRLRLWLALGRIRRRNRKLTKFYLRNISGQ